MIRKSWTKERVIEEGFKKFKDRFDYSEVIDNGQMTTKTLIKVICRKYDLLFEVSIKDHFNGGKCPRCTKCLPYTLDLVLEKAKKVWGDKYDLSLVTEEHIKGARSKIPIKCSCQHVFYPAINSFLNHKIGCPKCSGKLSYTLDLFLEKAKEVWGEKYDLSLITEDQIKNNKSKISIRCQCDHIFHPEINSFLNHKTGCPKCARKSYTLDLFLKKAKEIWGDTYDLSLVTEDQIKGANSKISIRCQCDHVFYPTINFFLNQKSGCPKCARKSYTLDLFLKKAKEVWGDTYDLSLVTEDQIKGANSKVSIRCQCDHVFHPSINNFLSGKTGCPECNSPKYSKGSEMISNVLTEWKIDFTTEFKIPERLGRKAFDFMFIFNNQKYLLEFDGKQHFEFIPYFHKTEEKFYKRQVDDRLKQKIALDEGYRMIRIHWKCWRVIEAILFKAFEAFEDENIKVYYSKPELYGYLEENN